MLTIYTSYYLQIKVECFGTISQRVFLKPLQMDVDAFILSEFLVVSQCFIILPSSGSDLLPTCEVTVCTNESLFTPDTDSAENSEFFTNSGKASLKLKTFTVTVTVNKIEFLKIFLLHLSAFLFNINHLQLLLLLPQDTLSFTDSIPICFCFQGLDGHSD